MTDVYWTTAAAHRQSLGEARAAAVEAHREARHEGLWEYCTDPICSALERWFHFEGVR